MAHDSAERGYSNRRRFLHLTGAAGVVSLAGCASGNNDDDDSEGDEPREEVQQSSSSGDSEPDEIQEGGTLRVAYQGDPDGLDPYAISEASAWNTVYNICETLITFEDGEVTGRLAEEFEVDENVYYFKLEEGVQFHGGYGQLTASDVVYSFERMQEEDSRMRSDLEVLDEVREVGEYEVELELEEVFGPFVAFLTRPHWVIVSEEAVTDQGGSIGDYQEPVGTGPFVFEEYRPDDRIELSAFDDYYGEGPYVDEIDILIIPDNDARALALENDDVDFAESISGQDVERILDNEETKTALSEATTWVNVHFNSSQEPWSNPDVRRALSHALDRQAVVDAVLEGFGDPSVQTFPEGHFWYHENLDNERWHDPERAQEILAEAGNPLEGETLEIKTSSDFQTMEGTAQILQANLAEIGVEAELNNQEFTTHVTDYVEGNYGALAFSEPFEVDPDRHYWNSFVNPGYNHYGESQPDGDRLESLLREARTTSDDEQRKELYREAEEIVQENTPWLSVALGDTVNGMRENVHGFQDWTLPYDRYWTMWIEQ